MIHAPPLAAQDRIEGGVVFAQVMQPPGNRRRLGQPQRRAARAGQPLDPLQMRGQPLPVRAIGRLAGMRVIRQMD